MKPATWFSQLFEPPVTAFALSGDDEEERFKKSPFTPEILRGMLTGFPSTFYLNYAAEEWGKRHPSARRVLDKAIYHGLVILNDEPGVRTSYTLNLTD